MRITWIVGDAAATLALPPGLGRLEWRPASTGTTTEGNGAAHHKRLDVRFGLTGLSCRRTSDSHTRSLKKLYQALGIPVWRRPYVPLVFASDSLIALAGICHCQSLDVAAKPMGELLWLGHPWNDATGLVQVRTGRNTGSACHIGHGLD